MPAIPSTGVVPEELVSRIRYKQMAGDELVASVPHVPHMDPWPFPNDPADHVAGEDPPGEVRVEVRFVRGEPWLRIGGQKVPLLIPIAFAKQRAVLAVPLWLTRYPASRFVRGNYFVRWRGQLVPGG